MTQDRYEEFGIFGDVAADLQQLRSWIARAERFLQPPTRYITGMGASAWEGAAAGAMQYSSARIQEAQALLRELTPAMLAAGTACESNCGTRSATTYRQHAERLRGALQRIAASPPISVTPPVTPPVLTPPTPQVSPATQPPITPPATNQDEAMRALETLSRVLQGENIPLAEVDAAERVFMENYSRYLAGEAREQVGTPTPENDRGIAALEANTAGTPQERIRTAAIALLMMGGMTVPSYRERLMRIIIRDWNAVRVSKGWPPSTVFAQAAAMTPSPIARVAMGAAVGGLLGHIAASEPLWGAVVGGVIGYLSRRGA